MIWPVVVVVAAALAGLVRLTNGDMVRSAADIAAVFAYFLAVQAVMVALLSMVAS